MKKIKNWIGRLFSYGKCKLCRDTWNWKKSKTISYSDHEGLFALCEECFNEAPEDDIFWIYKRSLNDIIKDNPIEWTRTKINNALRKLKKEIKKDKIKINDRRYKNVRRN